MTLELRPGMKPSDHPDFFRLPPPPGRSRESRIVLDEQGRFWNAGVLVEHARIAAAFATFIRKHPEDGRFILTNGWDWTYFTVKDAPFFVRHVDVAAGDAPVLRLSDGTEEPLDPGTVTVSGEGILYAKVKGGEFEARFLASAQSAMVAVLAEGEGGEPCVELRGARFPVRTRDARGTAPTT